MGRVVILFKRLRLTDGHEQSSGITLKVQSSVLSFRIRLGAGLRKIEVTWADGGRLAPHKSINPKPRARTEAT